ncbi:hypothetical protein GLA29479_1373 [Lysobacter antibioticus]|nr:hypothetical protein GLA29479_1373 [Lysobacter antibioticus]
MDKSAAANRRPFYPQDVPHPQGQFYPLLKYRKPLVNQLLK